MGFKRDFSISYLAGVLGGLVVFFSIPNSSEFNPGVFWVYALGIYFLVLLLSWIYGNIK